jgi:hypothetical protein
MSAARINVFNPSMHLRYLPEDDPYPVIRSSLAPEFATLPVEDLERVLENNGIRAADMEGFLDDVGHAFSSAGKAIAPIATKALPGIISGAATGCALGPWGCLGGALIGGVGSALASGGGKPAGGARGSSPAASIASAVPAIAGAVGAGGGGGGIASGIASALPAIAGLVGGGGGAGVGGVGKANPAGVLLGLFQRPEFLDAMKKLVLGDVGGKDVSVGGTSVPVSAFANLVGTLGSKAFAQAEATAEPSEDLPDYLYSRGALTVDPAVPSQRAARLLEMLGEVALRTPRVPKQVFSEADEYYDALDIAELDFLETEGSDFEFDD